MKNFVKSVKDIFKYKTFSCYKKRWAAKNPKYNYYTFNEERSDISCF